MLARTVAVAVFSMKIKSPVSPAPPALPARYGRPAGKGMVLGRVSSSRGGEVNMVDDDQADADTDGLIETAALAFRSMALDFVRRYNRLDIEAERQDLHGPVLFVANHGFGGIFDLNVFATGAALDELGLERPLTILTHQIAWTLGVGRLIEPLGARPAARHSVEEAFDEGHHVLVFPGGELDAGKSWENRNRIVFGGRTGFARLAIETNTPIVPVVTAGAGESLFVLSSGEKLARITGLDRIFRVKAAPTTLSLPWGLNVGTVGILPYLPLPTKLRTRVLPALRAAEGEQPETFAARVEGSMQDALTEMTHNRRPIIG